MAGLLASVVGVSDAVGHLGGEECWLLFLPGIGLAANAAESVFGAAA